jgi:hypothetical protein
MDSHREAGNDSTCAKAVDRAAGTDHTIAGTGGPPRRPAVDLRRCHQRGSRREHYHGRGIRIPASYHGRMTPGQVKIA